jgi:hypothetical protein
MRSATLRRACPCPECLILIFQDGRIDSGGRGVQLPAGDDGGEKHSYDGSLEEWSSSERPVVTGAA